MFFVPSAFPATGALVAAPELDREATGSDFAEGD
jgi:hypothetical protein